MAWHVTGDMLEFCNCKLLCPCWLGPTTEPDQGWCGGGLVFEIEQGAIDGVDVGGCKVALVANWPGNFFGGNGTARLYLDESSSAEQRRELEAVFTGQKGGLPGGLFAAVIKQWLPARTTSIELQRGETTSATVGEFAQIMLAPLKDQEGRPTMMQGAPAQAAFQSANMQLASSKGTRWSDPELRQWEGDSATIHTFNWSA